MKYATVLVALFGVTKALKVDGSATLLSTAAADENCPDGFHDGKNPGYCMPNS